MTEDRAREAANRLTAEIANLPSRYSRVSFSTQDWADIETLIDFASPISVAGKDEIERDEARQIVRDIYWMARRYADGRASYAAGMFNDAIRKAYDAGWLDHRLADEPPFARDSMFSPEWRSVEQRAQDAEAEVARLRKEITTALHCTPSNTNFYDCGDPFEILSAALHHPNVGDKMGEAG